MMACIYFDTDNGCKNAMEKVLRERLVDAIRREYGQDVSDEFIELRLQMMGIIARTLRAVWDEM